MENSDPIRVNRVRNQTLQYSKDYVRCFCNLPQCIATSYMCKSSHGGCFSHFLDHNPINHDSKDYKGRHGCMESINKDRKCEIESDPSQNIRISCCYHDMCNHIDNPHTNTIKNTLNNSDLLEGPQRQHHFAPISSAEALDYTSWQVWFRAATIAVPVCGAVILFVLIALAIKILRNENGNAGSTNRKLGGNVYEIKPTNQCTTYENLLRKQPKYYCDDSTQANKIQIPLLIQNEIVSSNNGKNVTNAKFSLIKNGVEAVDFRRDFVNNAVVLDIEKKLINGMNLASDEIIKQ